MDPLPEELAQLTRAARAAHRADQEHVDSLIQRLERARQALDAGAGPGDELLSLASYLKTSNAESAQKHKDWGNAVNKLAKSVDRVRGVVGSIRTPLALTRNVRSEIRRTPCALVPAAAAAYALDNHSRRRNFARRNASPPASRTPPTSRR